MPSQPTVVDAARQVIQSFANKHQLVFQDRSKIGFGRPCVGLMHGNHYVSYNPYTYVYDSPFAWNISYLKHADGFPVDSRLYPPVDVNAYHKDNCIAVLVESDEDMVSPEDYETAIVQLAEWVRGLDALDIEVAPYDTGAQGLQTILSGYTRYAIRAKVPKP